MNDATLFPNDRPVPCGDPSMVPNTPVPTGKNHPWTSHAAARKAAMRAGTDREAVYRFIESRGVYGATDSEILAGTGVDATTPRRIGLRDDGLIVDSGRTRLTPKGNPSVVWVLPCHAAGGGS